MKMNRLANAYGFALTALAFALLTGCENPHHDMGKQEKYNTYEQSEFFPDGSSARQLPPGSIPRDSTIPGWPFAKATPQDVAAATDQKIPFPITADVLHQGRESFNIFCSECHGRLGNAEGMIVQRGLTRPPSFHVPRLKQAVDSHFYNVITYGYGQMFSYNDRVPANERWQIIAYIRSLQAAGDEASPEVKTMLISQGDRITSNAGGSK